MLNCREATQLLSASQERTLTLAERLSLKLHLSFCDGCSHFKVQMGALRLIAHRYGQKKDDQPDS